MYLVSTSVVIENYVMLMSTRNDLFVSAKHVESITQEGLGV